jgi:outer membrane immunogenic protein
MKNYFKFAFAIIIMGLTTFSYSQVGLKLGMNMAKVNLSDQDDLEEPNQKFKNGISAGLYYEFKMGTKLSFQPELNFIQHGFKIVSENSNESGSLTLTQNYLQVPILAKYHFGNIDKSNFYLEGGPYLGYGIGKMKIDFCDNGDCESTEIGFRQEGVEVDDLDYGFQFGFGANITQNISIDARYILGLNNLAQDTEDNVFNQRGINLNIGYKLGK